MHLEKPGHTLPGLTVILEDIASCDYIVLLFLII